MRFGERKQMPVVRVDNAKEVLQEGLSSYIDGVPEWLKEYDSVAEWLTDNKGKGLLAIGDAGRGKTVICVDILPDIFANIGISCHVVSSYNMSRDNDLYKSSVLVIDDIGIEDTASFYGERHEIFAEVVDQAERKGIMLIVTSNLTNSELFKRYGKRVFDRLSKSVKPIMFKGDSLRGREVVQPLYVYGVKFYCEEDADRFEAEQHRIREGIESGRLRIYDDWAQEAYELNEALTEMNGTVYKYGKVKK